MASKYIVNTEELNKLNTNQVISSKACLCQLLFGKKPDGKNARNYMQEELDRYIKFEKLNNSNKIIIKEIYDTPIVKTENRGGRNNTKYIQYLEKLILNYGSFRKTSNQIYSEIIGIGNSEFWCKKLKVSSFEWYFRQIAQDKLSSIINSAFYSLSQSKRIEHTFIWVKEDNHKFTELNPEEKEIVNKIQNDICNELGYELKIILRKQKIYYKYMNMFDKEISKYNFKPFLIHDVYVIDIQSLSEDEVNNCKKQLRCKCQYKNVGFVSYKHVGKPTFLYDIF